MRTAWQQRKCDCRCSCLPKPAHEQATNSCSTTACKPQQPQNTPEHNALLYLPVCIEARQRDARKLNPLPAGRLVSDGACVCASSSPATNNKQQQWKVQACTSHSVQLHCERVPAAQANCSSRCALRKAHQHPNKRPTHQYTNTSSLPGTAAADCTTNLRRQMFTRMVGSEGQPMHALGCCCCSVATKHPEHHNSTHLMSG